VVHTLRQVLPDVVATVTPVQASAAWTAFPVQCERLQDQVTVMINNGGRFAPLARQRTGVPKRSLVARLVHKQGRLRGNIFARRTDQNARSVIKPDRWLDIDQLGVPQVFMNTLTKPEEVHAGNRARLQAAVERGPGVTGGAARVLRANGRLIQLHLLKPDMPRVVVEPGDVVERHLLDGDVGIFNRQPTLHKLGMMAHRLVGVPGEAFCVPLAVMGPYNADCDGDEMNLHILQSIHGDTEARMLLSVMANVINPQTNAPCVSLVQDARVGAMLLTSSSTVLSQHVANACATAIRYKQPGKETLPLPACVDPATGHALWTGRQIVSMMIPPGVCLTRRVRGAGPDVGPDDPEDRFVQVKDGVLLHGALCKATLGTGHNSLIHRIHLVAGARAVIQFLSDFQRVVYTWMPMRGFTMGLQDCLASRDTKDMVRAAVRNADQTVEALTRRAADLGPNALAPAEAATLEAHLLTILTSVLDFGSRCVLEDDVGCESGFRAMVTAGSKGNTNNVAQVMACLGQQVIEGGRVAPSGPNSRTLPSFAEGAFSAAARGFITRSYADGVSPAEYYYHMMAGREGLTATAVKTSETGYKYRVMAKAMETNTVRWDGTVRNGQSYILECVAGGDCCAATAVQKVDLGPAVRGTWQDVQIRMGLHDALDVGDDPDKVQEATDLRTQYALYAQRRIREGLYTPCLEGSATILLPVHPTDELESVALAISTGRVRLPAEERDSDALLRTAVDALVAAIIQMLPTAEAGVALALSILWDMTPTALRATGVHTARAFRDTVGAATYTRFLDALVAPGESVGTVAAQSIGEPSTQLTLNVFHHAGLMDRHLTSGVPRLKEILHAAPRIRTPSTIAPIRASAGMTLATASRAALSLQFLCLDTAVHSSYAVLDPVQTTAPWTSIVKDAPLVHHVFQVFGQEPEDASPWVVRITLNRAVLTEGSMTPETVARAIADQLPATTTASIVYSEPNMRRWVLRIRVRGNPTEHAARVLHSHLRESVLLGGIHGVQAARVIEHKRTTVDPDTGALVQTARLAVDMEGTALRALATRDWVQWEAVVTNDIMEVFAVLGIAAFRAVLFAELDRVISTGGGQVDPRHLAQVVATMTHRGWPMPLTRHGINRVNLSVLQRTSFEEPVEMLLQGAVQGQTDPLRGLCECVYVGAKPPIGTGTVGVVEDYQCDRAPSTARATVGSREINAHPGQGKLFRPARNAIMHGARPHRTPRHAFRQAAAQYQTANGPMDTHDSCIDDTLEALLAGDVAFTTTSADGVGVPTDETQQPQDHAAVKTHADVCHGAVDTSVSTTPSAVPWPTSTLLDQFAAL
jgi:DNA-directed RNA polymerase II subunit RPB1